MTLLGIGSPLAETALITFAPHHTTEVSESLIATVLPRHLVERDTRGVNYTVES
jgi:hypothetical protein